MHKLWLTLKAVGITLLLVAGILSLPFLMTILGIGFLFGIIYLSLKETTPPDDPK